MIESSRLHVDIELMLDSFMLKVELKTHAQVTGVFGPSGCGKSSFVESVAGLRRQAAGRIRLGETRWLDSDAGLFLPPEKRGVGYVPQSGLLFPHLSVGENLRSGFRRARDSGKDAAGICSNVVELLELRPLLDRSVSALSGGERQRVALGRALCSAPRLLLLDEPLAALDQPLREKILPFLRRVRAEFDVPMILVSHDPIEIQALCDDVVVLREGAVIARGAPRDVLIDPSVFPIANERGFENVLPCTTIASDEWGTTVGLGSPPTELRLELINRSPGPASASLVAIPARDVIIALERPPGISARNVLPAVIEEVHTVGNFVLVKAALSPQLPGVAVEVGRAACRELDLRHGRSVFLIVKAMSCRMFAEKA